MRLVTTTTTVILMVLLSQVTFARTDNQTYFFHMTGPEEGAVVRVKGKADALQYAHDNQNVKYIERCTLKPIVVEIKKTLKLKR